MHELGVEGSQEVDQVNADSDLAMRGEGLYRKDYVYPLVVWEESLQRDNDGHFFSLCPETTQLSLSLCLPGTS